ncbi:DsbA family protein [Nocardia puris]|uniref:Protein-disulfide isomerase n=1 Tax=Nocardia puris TaxID=208602 RepID=A0A366E212_9NOCA|nr:thioredoxin domain-containing protein [Nocardia puris]RBO96352.1 protein-disulfide isomerase [Nocardia puris]
MTTAPPRARRLRLAITLAAVCAVVVTGIVLVAREQRDAPTSAAPGPAAVVRPDSHRLDAPEGARVTLVEFLDFECEACAAMYPVVERLREEYRDRVTFVVRYFPVPSHFNAERAARAVEAAARQGRFEQMYQQMFRTQAGWGERRVPLDEVFRGFARELGLDMAAFDADYADPRVGERVRADFEDGLALGVRGTPTFFVDGEPIVPNGYESLAEALDAALR